MVVKEVAACLVADHLDGLVPAEGVTSTAKIFISPVKTCHRMNVYYFRAMLIAN